ncbi:iron-containing alcohol dehydrogenase [Propioniciclava sinopodophylli]|uniref:Iron-containing alcohol dehydrogenase n=1 Tax=Propioniciclava sinopodophylli TaxID=1837344 RepID=A0A4Q9KDS4_9ACTN|nr:sn-glycerol-1-phosphate dehydrogenase [Propioniciclava sinopodophylli]TBT85027.1 iron-containing alcohol dehydrogenase [Propioniciclava sinopodophylli]
MTNQAIADGLRHASDTRVIEVGRAILSRTGEILARSLAQPGRPLLIVADERTWVAAGEAVAASLQAAGLTQTEPLVFPGTPTLYAAYEHCETIRERLMETNALGVAVGAGTLNDLVKLASGELDQPYAVVGTAASMDGYSGFGAPMSQGGVKITMPCPAPAVVLFDLDVAAAAPKAMVASGYGDLAAKIPAGADWILSDAIGLDPIDPLAWDLVQGGVAEALSRPDALAAGDADAYEGLVEGLLLSGLAMQVYKGTRPASGAEHYFSHLWELDHLGADLDPPLSHGYKVAIGTLAMTAFYERFMARDLAAIDVDAVVAAWPTWDAVEADIRSKLTGPLAEKGVRETREKYVDAAGLRTRVQTLVDGWPSLRPRLVDQLMPARDLQRMLAAAGTPTRPEDIGLTLAELKDTFPKAMYYRSRYTVLDVTREIGWFDELVDEVFAPGGLWT